jgi:hypothetical protein
MGQVPRLLACHGIKELRVLRQYLASMENKGLLMRSRLFPLIALLLLSGCAEDIRAKIDDVFGRKDEPKKIVAADPRYCYRTIGKVNCYAEPLEGQEANRLIGYDGPAPRSTAGTGPLRP